MAERILNDIPDTDWPSAPYIHPDKKSLLREIVELTSIHAKREASEREFNYKRVESLRRSFSGFLSINPNEVTSSSYLNNEKERVWEFTIGRSDSSMNLAIFNDLEPENKYGKIRWNLTKSEYEIPSGPENIIDSEGNRFVRLGWVEVEDPMRIVNYVRSLSGNSGTRVLHRSAA